MSLPLDSDARPAQESSHLKIIPSWMRNPAGAVMIAAVFFGLLGTITLALEIGRPFGNFAAYGFIKETTKTQLAHETPQWWPPLADASLQYGDYLLTINGLPFLDHAWQEMAQAYHSGRPILLGIERPGVQEPVVVSVPVSPFTWWDFLDIKLPEILVGVVFWFLAVVVLRARPDSITNRVFASVAACVAIHRLTAVSSLITDDRLLVNLPKVGHMIAAGLIGPMLIHLAFLFPAPLERMPRKLIIAVYIVGMLFGFTLAFTRLPWWGIVPSPIDQLIGYVAYQGMLLLLLGGVIALFARLILSVISWRTVPKRERQVVRIVLFGLVLSLPAILVVLAPLLPGYGAERSTFWQWLDLRYLMLAIPIAFALVIIRYRAFQSPSPLFIFLIVISLSAMLAAVGVSFWALTQPDDQVIGQRPPFEIFFLLIFGASFFWSRQADWRGWFGRVFYRTEQNFQAARGFGNRVMGTTDFRKLPDTMAQALVDEFNLEWAGILIRQPGTASYDLAAAAGESNPGLSDRIEIRENWLSGGRAFNARDASRPEWARVPGFPELIEVIVPLEVENQLIGLLGLGRRWDEEIFDERDLAAVELVGQQAALFLLAASQVEELRRVPGLISEAQERERYRLAGELHDTIQQFLGRLPFFLAVSRDMVATDSREAVALIDRCIGEVEGAAAELRQIRANLAPNQLGASLIKPLVSLTSYVERQHGLAIRLRASKKVDDSTTVETRLALYRVIQQALDNAVAHSQATEVAVILKGENGRVEFKVADNGRGSTESERRASLRGGSFGLQSMRARVEAVGGEFQFNSIDGQGTTVSGWVPAAGKMPD